MSRSAGNGLQLILPREPGSASGSGQSLLARPGATGGRRLWPGGTRRTGGARRAAAIVTRGGWLLIRLVGLVGLFGLVGLGGGCKRQGPAERAPLAVRVVRVQVEPGEDFTALGAPALGVAELTEAARAGLQRAGVRVEPAPQTPEPGDFTLQMELALKRVTPRPGTPDAGPERLRALAAGQLRARAGGSALDYDQAVAARKAPELLRLQHVAVVERPTDGQHDLGAAWGQLAQRAIGESAHTLGEQLRLLGSPSAQLVTVLGDKKAAGDVRGVAAQLLAARRESAAVPALIELLREKDQPSGLRDQAIGALVELGDRRAVRPLLDSARFNDEIEMGKVVEAVAALGGAEARSYLQFVAASHSEPRIKEEATAALKHLEQREQRRDASAE